MDMDQVRFEPLTSENMHMLLAALDHSEELEVDPARLKEFLSHPQNLAFMALYHGEVCGFLYGYTLLSLTSPPQLFVYSVDVLRRFQNRGVGSRLFQYAVDYSREKGYAECFVITDKGNKAACRIYEKAGGKSDFEDEIVYVIQHRRRAP